LKIRWTKGASDNLENIKAYIDEDNQRAALETVLKVVHSVSQLSKHPTIGRPGRLADTRELIVADTPFIVPYRIKNEIIQILRVLHYSQKWPKKL